MSTPSAAATSPTGQASTADAARTANTARAARTIVLLRHAKTVEAAEAGSGGSGEDVDRPLAAQGRADASAAGSWFSQSGVSVDLVLCSPAVRARETWQLAVAGGAAATRVQEERRVYEASVEDLLAVLRELPSAVRSVVLVGHAPGVPALAGDLADRDRSDAEARAALDRKFATTGLARLRYEGDWADLGPGDAALVEFVTPRG